MDSYMQQLEASYGDADQQFVAGDEVNPHDAGAGTDYNLHYADLFLGPDVADAPSG